MTTPHDAAGDPGTSTVDERTREAPFGAPHAFVLVVVDGDNPAAVYRLVRTETVLGRGEEADISIVDEQISKQHCKFRIEGPVCTIVDLGSRNGTSVNDRRIPPNVAQRLKSLDEIEVGSHRLLLMTGRFRGAVKNAKR